MQNNSKKKLPWAKDIFIGGGVDENGICYDCIPPDQVTRAKDDRKRIFGPTSDNPKTADDKPPK